jgi:hypothetical protein
MPGQIDKFNVLRAAILMHADSMLSDLRSIRDAKTLEDAQVPINRMIDRVNALSDAAERVGEERGSAGFCRVNEIEQNDVDTWTVS